MQRFSNGRPPRRSSGASGISWRECAMRAPSWTTATKTLPSNQPPHLLQFVDAVKKLMGRTYDIQDQRNRIIHDPWYVATVTSLSGHGSPAQFKSMPAKELE